MDELDVWLLVQTVITLAQAHQPFAPVFACAYLHHGAKLIGIFAPGEKQPSTFPSPRAQTDRQSIGARSMQEVGSCSIALSILLSGSAECARAPFDPQKASSIFCALPPDRFLKKILITDARAGPPREIASEDCVSAKAWRRT